MKIETMTPEEAKRRTRLTLPPSLDEETVAHVAVRDKQTGEISDPAVAGLAAAVKIAREEAAAPINVEKFTLSDTTLTADAALLSVAQAALASGTRVATRLDAARGRAKAEIESINKRTSCPPAPTGPVFGLQHEIEIRTALAGMPERVRESTINDAFKTKDLSIIGAVLRAPAFLSGVGKARLELIRAQYQREFHPGDAERVDVLNKALEATERAGVLFMKMVREASESPVIQLAQAGVRNRREAEQALKARGV
ncbi:hypothetical protein [Mesorhizobium sp. CN2-181]|uniref:hypothetical protein n=1 Tax=Mesorhizobium yinganensis TaxID=3157707 RepID=UPI0032B86ABF